MVAGCKRCGARWIALWLSPEGLLVDDFVAKLTAAVCPDCGLGEDLVLDQSREALVRALQRPLPEP